MVVSELLFYQDGMPIKPVAGQQSWLGKDLKEKAPGTVLAKILYRNLNIEAGQADTERSRSLILCSGYSFMYYNMEWIIYGGVMLNNEKGADGSWGIMHLAKVSALVRIFGKIASTSRRTDFYVGNTKENQVPIFQDYVNILPNRL